MGLLLGVDTGGTYTDAVLIQDEARVIAAAKSLTTRYDLAVGVGRAVKAVLDEAQVPASDVALASLSTTLATNALVEGQGGRIAFVFIGFRERDLETHGLSEALKGDPYILVSGGHNHAGGEAQPLDKDAVRQFLEEYGHNVSAFAVASQFATRNPSHELFVMELVTEVTGRPMSASHQLSAKLNGPKRALTAVLNARLIGMIDQLIGRAEVTLANLGVTAPMMVVRGDGALISAAQARDRPIETILSGPAASLVGARWLTGMDHALVSDIGGTTTDIALLREGRPQIDPGGARVGPYRTMVEAVAMRTTGLGGDSEVHFVAEGLQGGVVLGPRRLLPISLLAVENPDVVHNALDAQLRTTAPGEHDTRFVRAVNTASREGLSAREGTLLDRIGEDVHPISEVVRARVEMSALTRLMHRGLIQIAGVTPSDASHVLGRLREWDAGAARKALALFGRRRTGAGTVLSTREEDVAQIIVDQLTHQTTLALLECALAEEENPFQTSPETLARHELMQRGLTQGSGLVRLQTGLNVPVVGLGASAAAYYPAVGDRLGCEMVLPIQGGVANAIGAVVGRVTMRQSGTVTAPAEGLYRVHVEGGPEDFSEEAAALDHLEDVLRTEAIAAAQEAGAVDISVTAARDVRKAGVESREVFVEAEITVEASGRPRIGVDNPL